MDTTLFWINGYDSLLPYPAKNRATFIPLSKLQYGREIGHDRSYKYYLDRVGLQCYLDTQSGVDMDTRDKRGADGKLRKDNGAGVMYGSLPNLVSQQYISNYKATLRQKATKIKSMFGNKPQLNRTRNGVNLNKQDMFKRWGLKESDVFKDEVRSEPVRPRLEAQSDVESVISNHQSPTRCWVTPFRNDPVPTLDSMKPRPPRRGYSPSVASTWDTDQDSYFDPEIASTVAESIHTKSDRYRHKKAKMKTMKSKKLGNVVGAKKMLQMLDTSTPIKVENLIGYRHNKSN